MIDELAQATGLLTLDPRDQRLQIMGERSVISHQIILPEQRMAKWQMASRVERGKWLATPKAMLWTSLGGRSLQSMTDDGQGLESFAISPDGQSAAWATKLGKVYVSRNGETASFVGPGRDPSWHPTQNVLLYAAARMVGDKATDYDLRLIDSKGVAKWVTQTQHSAERWPQWMPKADQILYTKERTTDLFVLDFQQ
jgi:Tol biopolymer transport system component